MTLIDFYSGVDDKLHTACRLSAKAVQQGLKVMIYTPDAQVTEQLDQLLWTFSSTSFIPHCRANDMLASKVPVVLSQQSEEFLHDDVLLNLNIDYPSFFSRFKRLIEIIGTTSEDIQAARKRYRFYQDRGYEIRIHKLNGEQIR
ncbi:MAG: DNA polymerase III subunit chi [Nitrosospira sp.]|nr:DNA polymerase III subunit chi [Nitrosospira sp.]MDW7643340.1 DNA polymerase III subunit chi [Nitrosomonadaceae bacterium]MBI0407163.1 DNA polymerase III subunit chi [Nitrosospira sp.]MBI0414074.1 DNA polymerase III subunit chi [Nitrosospira sp.]MBI0416339.1 DNA polymerase III subunit chi [Nitrosospira sp.]